MDAAFTYRTSRSGSILAALLIAVGIETLAIYLWLHSTHPLISWLLLAIIVLSAVWIVWDYAARGVECLRLDDDRLVGRIGLRPPLTVPADLIVAAVAPTWREMPKPGASYLNLTA